MAKKMHGNMKAVGRKIPGASDFHDVPSGTKEPPERLFGNETTYYDQQLRPGPRLQRPRKRGKRISNMRTANDAAMALSEAFRARCDKSSGAGYGGKSSFRWFKGLGYK
jgi:hypothetical protein